MSDAIPSVTLYSQALTAIQNFAADYTQGKITGPDAITQRLSAIISDFQKKAGGPLLKYSPVVETEPPSSLRMNTFWQSAQWDLSILQNQLDILRSGTLIAHNMITTELEKATNQSSQLRNKLAVLELYSNSVSPDEVIFGDSFQDGHLLDDSLIQPGQKVGFLPSGGITLGALGSATNLAVQATITVLSSSNGFLGNNQEVDLTKTTSDPATGEKRYHFYAQDFNSGVLSSLTDNQPNTWFEYEHCVVSPTDQAAAGGLNFTYQDTYSGNYVNWATVPNDYQLNLGLQFDLGQSQITNEIIYDPYGLEDNKNYPVLVNSVQVSADGTNWTTLSPTKVWIGTQANLSAERTAPNVVIGSGVWSAEGNLVRYVNINITQPQSVSVPIGHLYYTDSTGNRVEGPEPPVTNPGALDSPSNLQTGSLLQHTECFNGTRYAIGIRDISINQTQYSMSSTAVSQLLEVGGIVDRVALEANVLIPSSYDNSQQWVQFYISPDNGTTWCPISRMQDNSGSSIPAILAFNDPLPTAFRDPGVGYYNVSNPVMSLRLKVVLNSPGGGLTATPIVYGYKLKVKKR